jgi:peptide/nickel transport system permease protein
MTREAGSRLSFLQRIDRFVRMQKAAAAGALLLAAIVLCAALAPQISPHDPNEQNIALALAAPSPEHWLGNDTFGRDTLSRIIWGARISLFVSFSSVLTAMVIGGLLGMLAGYYGGRVDRFIMGVMDVLLSFPSLVMGLLVIAVLGPTLVNLIVAIAVTAIAPFARIARAPTLSIRSRDFVDAARTFGSSDWRIIARYILPNVADEVVVIGALWLATAVRTEASLSFLGLGVRPPTPTWGGMIREGFESMLDSPWLVLMPSFAILALMIAINLVGDGIRDATDPRLRQE